MSSNQVIIAAAGSGKTTLLVKKSLENPDATILITTYTQSNEKEIKKKFFELNKCIPANVTIQTWYSFLLKHGVRPYQSYLFNKKIEGFILVNSQSAKFTKENDIQRHYFSKEKQIYSDKVAKFVVKCNIRGKGCIFNRLERIYSHIFIDEVQDLAGYDLEILKLLFASKLDTLMVCDPRQSTYSTNSYNINTQFRKSLIVNFFERLQEVISLDANSLRINHRCTEKICNLSNKLFPDFPSTTSGNQVKSGHDGVFLVKPEDVENYLAKYKPVQLRDSIKTPVNPNFSAMNFGDSKGLSFDRVLIYPTVPICNWLLDHSSELAQISRSKLYVALTRARQSVGIVYNFDSKTEILFTDKYINNETNN